MQKEGKQDRVKDGDNIGKKRKGKRKTVKQTGIEKESETERDRERK